MQAKEGARRNYSAIDLEEAMLLIGQEILLRWEVNTSPRQPSEFLLTHLERLESFERLGQPASIRFRICQSC